MEDKTLQKTDYEGGRILEFCRDSLRKASFAYMAWLSLAGLASLGIYLIYRGSLMSSIRMSLFIYYLVIIIHFIFRFKKYGKVSIMTPEIFFLLIYTMFHLGYVTLYALGIFPYLYGIFVYEASIPKALFIVNLGLISFLLGYELLGPKIPVQRLQTVVVPTRAWCTFGIAVMLIALLVHSMTLMFIGVTLLQTYGHKAIVYIHRYAPPLLALIFAKSTFLMVFGVMIYTISSALRYGKLFHSKIALGITMAYLFLLLLEVARGNMFRFFVPLLLVRHYLIRPIRIRHLVTISLSIVTLFSVMRIVKTIAFDPAKMLEEVRYQRERGLITWLDPFVEAGGSFRTLNITANDVPASEPYWKGASWTTAIYHIVPFLQGYLARHGLVKWAPSQWITITYAGPAAAGFGFTITAEGYLNFGYIGVVIELMFMGLFLRWLTVRFSRNPSAMWALIMFGCIGAAIGVVRNHIGMATALWVQIAIIALLANMFFGNEQKYEQEDYAAWSPEQEIDGELP